MIVEGQAAVIEFLSSPSTHGGAAVERVETHASVVFLAGSRAWKLKRAVRYDYLDFSTPERRRVCCEAEVRLNRRTAPALYRGVVPVTREPDGSLALAGQGTAVDWLVEMQCFDQDALFDRRAAEGRLDLDLMPPLAAAIARFHLGADRRDDHGGRAGMAWVIDGNAAGFDEFGPGILDPTACARVTLESGAELDRLAGILESRRESGCVRQCHGDLHLRNIVLLDDRPTLFDGVEFNDEIACIDVLYDLAFLVMDLWRRGLRSHAHTLWNAYVGETGDVQGTSLLPLFLSCRAAVRAKTSATSASLQADSARRAEFEATARTYLRMAGVLLHPPAPCLIAIGGFSGSGKSTLAHGLGPAVGAVPGALVIRTDEVRKRLCGVAPLARLGPEGYLPEISRRVYAGAAERAGVVLSAGHAAIVDGVFARPSDRASIEAVAATAGVPFAGLWLDAPQDVLIERSRMRRLDPSDADADVIQMQRAQDIGTIGWHRVDASADAGSVLKPVTHLLGGLIHSAERAWS